MNLIDSKVYSIYTITCSNNQKKYVGFTNKNPHIRLQEHNYFADRGSSCYFHKAIKKYGIENFKIDIIYQSLDGEHCLNVMENFFIKKLNTLIPTGYNMTTGGDGRCGPLTEEHKKKIGDSRRGHHPSEETRRKISQSCAGKLVSKETRNKISIGNTGKTVSEEAKVKMCLAKSGKNNPMYGKHPSKNSRRKMREAKKNYWKHRKNIIDNKNNMLST